MFNYSPLLDKECIYPGYTGNVFEPADEFKGDFARSYFYVVTVYQDLASYWNSPMLNKNSYPVWKPWAIELLKQWHQQDPVSTKETLTGVLCHHQKASSNSISIPLTLPDVYILSVQHKDYFYRKKIIR